MKDEILHHIRYSLGKDAEHSSVYDWRIALSLALRDRMVDHWYRSTRETMPRTPNASITSRSSF